MISLGRREADYCLELPTTETISAAVHRVKNLQNCDYNAVPAVLEPVHIARWILSVFRCENGFRRRQLNKDENTA